MRAQENGDTTNGKRGWAIDGKLPGQMPSDVDREVYETIGASKLDDLKVIAANNLPFRNCYGENKVGYSIWCLRSPR